MQTSHPKTLVRALGAAERLMYHYSSAHPRHFCVVAEIKAVKRREDYEAACMAVSRRHPLLNVNVRLDGDGVPSFYASKTSLEPVLTQVRDVGSFAQFVADELVLDFHGTSPLCRIAVFYDGGAATIVLTMHHAIGDGLSGVTLIGDFLEALSGREIGSLPVPPAVEDDLGGREETANAVSEGAEALPPIEQLIGLASQPLWRSFDGDKVTVKTELLSAEHARKLRDLARENKTSVNSVICAAVAIVAARGEGRDTYRILSPVDLRRKFGLDARDSVLRATAGAIALPAHEELWTLARTHIGEMNRLRTTAEIRRTGRMLDQLITPSSDPRVAVGVLGALGYDAVVSNLGVIDIPQEYGDISLEAIWGPIGQARLKRERFFGVSTFAGTLRLIEACPASQELIGSDVVELLASACI
jgi:hypothetical protein